jgi:hypothetical protein
MKKHKIEIEQDIKENITWEDYTKYLFGMR